MDEIDQFSGKGRVHKKFNDLNGSEIRGKWLRKNMESTKIFFDINIALDIIDPTRSHHSKAKELWKKNDNKFYD